MFDLFSVEEDLDKIYSNNVTHKLKEKIQTLLRIINFKNKEYIEKINTYSKESDKLNPNEDSINFNTSKNTSNNTSSNTSSNRGTKTT